MTERDRAELERRFQQAVVHVRDTGSLQPSDLQIPILTDPYCKQPLPGYEGGWYDPYKLGAVCIVVPPSKGRGPNTKGFFNVSPDSIASKTATSVPGFAAVRAPARPNKDKIAPNLPGMYFKFFHEQPPIPFLVSDSESAANGRSREPYVLMLMPRKPPGRPRVAVPEPTTAVDDTFDTTVGASVNLSASSEITPDEFSEEVTGLIERLSLPGAANAGEAAGAGEGGGGTLKRALALKTQGNQHFSAGDCFLALPLYSEAIEMLEGADQDAAMATILCNRSVTHLKSSRPAAALTDAERARTLGGGKAHFRLAEALSSLGLTEDAVKAYDAARANAQKGEQRTLHDKIEALQSGRIVVRATPEDFAQQLSRAVAGTTLLLKPGRYIGQFQIRVGVSIGGEGAEGTVVLDSTEEGDGTLQVCCAGRVVLQSLDVRHTAGTNQTSALLVCSGTVLLPIPFPRAAPAVDQC